MRGNLRNKNRRQSQKEQLFEEGRFDAGWINDLPASDLPKGGMALLENFVGYPEYIEGRSGSQKFSDTVFPGSGTIHSLAQHPKGKKWVLHQGSHLYYADAAQATWTEMLVFGLRSDSPTVNGDTGGQLSAVALYHITSNNTNAGTVYWNLTNSGSTRTVNVYKDSGKTQLVVSGSRVGNGVINLLQQNNSGLAGRVTVAYTGDDTDAGNTFVSTLAVSSVLSISTDTHLEPFGDDFILFNTDTAQYKALIYVDLTNLCFFALNGVIAPSITNVATQTAATPYGYRYLYTFSRIVDVSTGALNSAADRVSGSLLFESMSNSSVAAGIVGAKDYGEVWLANPINGTTPYTLSLLSISFTVLGTFNSDAHYDHISLYRTMDIGVAGVDPVTGSGNNREIYTWVGDYDFSLASVSDSKSDDDLRAAFSAGFGLKSRFWAPIPAGEVGVISNNFIYSAIRDTNKVYYGQLSDKRFVGFYNPAYQFFKLDDAIKVISRSPDMVSFICGNKTYISNPNSYFNAGGLAVASIFVINHFTVASENIGVSDWGSFTKMDNGFIAHCTDHTIRIWNSSYWSDDIASRRISQIVRQMVVGSLGVYGAGAYYLSYRTDSGQTNNNLCLRYGFSREAGFGWAKVSGAAWPVPPTYAGAVQIIDSNNLQRIIMYDAVDTYAYWIETFTAYTGSSTTKVFKDKVATNGTGGTDIVCTARFREFTASDESMDLFHKESYIYDRPYDEATGYPSGFSRTLKVYTDGSTTAAATITAAPAKGDLQFFDKVQGNRIQMEVQFATSGARLTGIATLCDIFDRAAIGSRPSDGADATAQLALASNMPLWLTRPNNRLNRISGTNFTVNNTPTNVTGPDGRAYALSFSAGSLNGYVFLSSTTYTDFTIRMWIKSPTILQEFFSLNGATSVTVRLFDASTLFIGVGATFLNYSITSTTSGWHDIWIIRSGAALIVYENGIYCGTGTVPTTAVGGTSVILNKAGTAIILYDFRIYNIAIDPAFITYYYADVNTTLQGDKVLPLA